MQAFEHKVKVIGHLREGKDLDGVARFNNLQDKKKSLIETQDTIAQYQLLN